MKKGLQAVAALIAVGAIATWLATGAHRGWTKTSVPKMIVDEVTGIESPTYENRFVAGVDFLGGALLAAATLAGVSLFIRTNRKPKLKTED